MSAPISISPGPSSIGSRFARVGIIDDDPTVRRLMRYWLEEAGYHVEEAASAVEAKELTNLDVVCLDLGLGADSGLDLLAHFHAIDPQLPCVVVTAARQLDVWR